MKTLRIVITGGPCTGKTALIKVLEQQGYHCFPEFIRDLTAQESLGKSKESLISNPIVFADDSEQFNRMLIEGRSSQFKAAEFLDDPLAFYDRGLPDVLAYMDYFKQPFHPDFIASCLQQRYDHIFLLPPWQEIYARDEERYETYQEAKDIHKFLKKNYKSFNYNCVNVPKVSIEERAQFIISKVRPH